MQKKLVASVAAFATVAAILVSGSPAVAASSLSGKGSSFAANAMSYCAAHFDPASGDTVTYTSTGSGTGRSEFAAGNIQFAVSDGGYSSGYPSNRWVNVPLLGGPVVFAYNKTSKKIPVGLRLNATAVSGILKGTITKWNDAYIKKINPGKVLPAKTINVYYRTSGSGTTENLTTYLSQSTVTGAWLPKNKDLLAAAGGKLAATAKAKATSAVIADMVEKDAYGFGYFDLSDAAAAKVNTVLLKNVAGQYVAPTASAAIKFLNAQGLTKDATNTIEGDRTDGLMTIDFKKSVVGAYQLSIVTYGIAPRGTATSGSAFAVKGFFKYVLNTCMPAYAASHGYVALSGALKTKALAQVEAIG